MVQWNDFVTGHLMGQGSAATGKLKAAAIIGHDNAIRAESVAFPGFENDELKAVLNGFEDRQTLSTGLSFGGKTYTIMPEDDGENIIRGVCDTERITIKKAGTVFVVGIYDEYDVSTGNLQCDHVVRTLAVYLVGQSL